MNANRRVAGLGLLVLVLAPVLALAGPVGAASAASKQYLPRDPSPGSTYRYGISKGELWRAAAPTNFITEVNQYDGGGWIVNPSPDKNFVSGRQFCTFERDYRRSDYVAGQAITPNCFKLGEPYAAGTSTSAGAPNSMSLYIPIQKIVLPDNRSSAVPSMWFCQGAGETQCSGDGPKASETRAGARTSVSSLGCATAPWTTASAVVRRASTGSAGYGGNNWLPSGSSGGGTSLVLGTGTTAACNYVVYIQFSVCLLDGIATFACHQFTWVAEEAWKGTDYSGDVDPNTAICKGAVGAEVSPECPFIVDVDGTDPAVVCANAPQPVWLSFDWLPALIGHYARCLSIPANGWDKDDEIGSAWANSSAGDATNILTATVQSLAISESCGTLINVTHGALDGLNFSTCSLNEWAPAKSYLAIIGTFLFSVWAIIFFIRTVQGFVNRSVPTPVSTEGD